MNPSTSTTTAVPLLYQILQTLIDGSRWTYGICWQYSVDVSGLPLPPVKELYYKGEEIKNTNPSSAAEQERRKMALRGMYSWTSVGDSDDAEVSDPEWFFLVSVIPEAPMLDLPVRSFFSSNPVWLTGEESLLNSSCRRARQAPALGLKTMVCIPLANGVVELGSTELIFETPDLLYKVWALFKSS